MIHPEVQKKPYEKKKKRRSRKHALSLPFDNFKISFPSDLFKGQNIYNLMSKLHHISGVRL
jgi:NTE family protein